MDFALWSRPAVMQLIERECGIKLHVRSVGKYLTRRGFTPPKPIKKAYEQRPEAFQQWRDESYPAIEQHAKAEGAEIPWGDETALVNTDVRGGSDAPIGQTPVAYAVGGTRQELSMIATVTDQGKARRMSIDDAFNSDRLVEFLGALIKGAGQKKVFLILDNLRVNHSQRVKTWVSEHAEQIGLFYLHSYDQRKSLWDSPKLNPEERLNADVKHAIGSNVPAGTKARLRSAATQHMTELEQSPERIKAFFQEKHVRYAAQKPIRAGSIIATKALLLGRHRRLENSELPDKNSRLNENRQSFRL